VQKRSFNKEKGALRKRTKKASTMKTTKRRFCLPVSHAVNLYIYGWIYICVCVCVSPANQLNNRNQFAPLHSPSDHPSVWFSHPISRHHFPFRAHCHGASATVISSAISAYAEVGGGVCWKTCDISGKPEKENNTKNNAHGAAVHFLITILRH